METNEYTRMFNLETNFWWYKTLHELVDSVISQTKPEGEIRILDAGCGTGRMMQILQKYGTVYGIDFSEFAVHYAKERRLDNVFVGDLNDYNFEKESYDFVVCLDVLYHNAIKEDTVVIRKLYDTLKPDGILIINVPAFGYLRRSHDNVVHTRKRYRKQELLKTLREIDFTILKSSYRMSFLYFIILISKLFGGKISAENYKSDLKEIPDWLNTSLLTFGRIENFLLKKSFMLPVGSSLFVVAKKNSTFFT